MRAQVSLGVHGGLSQSCGVLAAGGTVHFHRELGTDFRDVPNAAVFPLEKIVRDLRRHTKTLPTEVYTGPSAIAVSGLDARIQPHTFRARVSRIGLDPERTILSNLAEAAHYGAFLGEDGILVRCGHGSSAHLKLSDTKERTVGAWGSGVGDLGSCPWIGKHAVRALAATVDDVAKPEQRTFAECVLEQLDYRTPSDALAGLEETLRESNSAARRFLYKLGSVTVSAAETGDDHAEYLVDCAIRRLLDLIRRPLSTSRDCVPLRVSGSLFERHVSFRKRFLAQACLEFPHLDHRDEDPLGHFSPIVGISLLARGLRTPDDIRNHGAELLAVADQMPWGRPGLALLASLPVGAA